MTALKLSNEMNIDPPDVTKADSPCPVSPHNEWDPLEEVIVEPPIAANIAKLSEQFRKT
jgi:hypothetical protein